MQQHINNNIDMYDDQVYNSNIIVECDVYAIGEVYLYYIFRYTKRTIILISNQAQW